MTVTREIAAPAPTAAPHGVRTIAAHRAARFGLWRELERPGQVFGHLTPNWFAAVMGTGIVAVAASGLPVHPAGLRGAAVVVWAMAAALLVVLVAATAVHWIRHPVAARGHASNSVMAHFYGAPPMAMLTVGAGSLLVGRDVLGLRAAVDVDWVLWFAGTLTGLFAAVAVPYLAFTRHEVSEDAAFGGWLMPVVPPMVSASTGALLVGYAPAGQPRLTLLLCCYAMFGMSLVASLIIIALIWQRLVVHKVGEARMVPTFWIVLGPVGQSVTAVNLLGNAAHLAAPAPYVGALKAFGVVYGVPVWGFAMMWTAVAVALTARTAARRLPFSLTWWSFTFPVGTCVTGTSALAAATGADLFRAAAVVLFAALVCAWLVVAVRTARSAVRGGIFLPPTPTAPMPAVV
jgi:C4-dicarboxylate transporter/malic acid transport protein